MADRKLLDMYEPKGSDLLSTFVDGLAANVRAIKAAFPVGCFYISTDPTSPQEILGGRWRAVGPGRVLMTAGFSDYWFDGDRMVVEDGQKAGVEGGQSRHSHLTSMGFDGNLAYCLLENGNPIFNSAVRGDCMGFNIQKSYDISHTQVRVAYTREQSSRPPYLTCYMWERVG